MTLSYDARIYIEALSNCSDDAQEEFKEELKSLSDERLEELRQEELQEHREETEAVQS